MNNIPFTEDFGLTDEDLDFDPFGLHDSIFTNETSPRKNTDMAVQTATGNLSPVMPDALTNPAYLPAYLKKQTGKIVRLEFQIGDALETRVGQLLDVGTTFVVIKLFKPSTTMICDISTIKFITVAHGNEVKNLV